MELRTRRVYATAGAGDGRRVLVDRLWPRGLSRAAARIDYWARDVAPSTGLRRSYRHDPARWEEFRDRYFRELEANAAEVAALREALEGAERVTFLYAARDEMHNNAVALADYLRGRR